MGRTKIEWALNPDGSPGYTLNPITGCENHTAGLCKGGGFPCYAHGLAHGRLKATYLANENIATVYAEGGEPYHKADKMIAQIDPFFPRFWPSRLAEIETLGRATADSVTGIRRASRRGIFVCSQGELFGPWLPKDWTEDVLHAIEMDPEDRFYLLTKQPAELKKWSPFPSNCYVGVTATGTTMYWRALAELQYIKASVKYVSIEPFLEPIKPLLSSIEYSLKKAGINWLIIGSQTRPYVPPQLDWILDIAKAADGAGIPLFLKNNLAPLPASPARLLRYKDGVGWGLRQEMPSEHSLENVRREK